MLNELAKEVHQNAINHGFDGENRTFGDYISLMHTELSEAFEESRNGRDPTEVYYSSCQVHECPYASGESSIKECYERIKNNTCAYRKPEGIPIELADCIIRILDYCGKEKIDIDGAIRIKMEYNKTRPYKHGGKRV